MWLWTLGDLVLTGVAMLISVVMLFKLAFFPPIVMTAVYAFLSIQFDGTSVKDFLRYAVNFFVTKPQYYTWRVWSDVQRQDIRRKTAWKSGAGCAQAGWSEITDRLWR